MIFYCRVSHVVQDGVTTIKVTVSREPFARFDDNCINVDVSRPEQAVMKALEEFLILEDA